MWACNSLSRRFMRIQISPTMQSTTPSSCQDLIPPGAICRDAFEWTPPCQRSRKRTGSNGSLGWRTNKLSVRPRIWIGRGRFVPAVPMADLYHDDTIPPWKCLGLVLLSQKSQRERAFSCRREKRCTRPPMGWPGARFLWRWVSHSHLQIIALAVSYQWPGKLWSQTDSTGFHELTDWPPAQGIIIPPTRSRARLTDAGTTLLIGKGNYLNYYYR
jgi:hypothetical protein